MLVVEVWKHSGWSLFSERTLEELCPRANSSLSLFSLLWSGCDLLSLENGRVS